MKILKQLFLVLIFISSLLSCKKSEQYSIGYLNSASFRLRFVDEGNFMAERLKELGAQTIILSAEDNDALQLQQGYELLEKGVNALVINAVNGITIAPLVRDAISQGVTVIAYNRLINNANYDLFFTGNNQDNARLFCEAALSNHPTGNYVIIAGDRSDRNGFELKQHIDSILKPHVESGKINIVFESYIEGWNQERARYEFQQVIDSHGTDIDVVIACNDPMGIGVIDVLKKYDLQNSVIVTGQDATPQVVKSIYSNEMHMTIYHPHRELGRKTAEIIIEMLNGKSASQVANTTTFNGLTDIQTYSMKSVPITKENLEDLVTAGQYSWDEIRR